MIGLLIYFVLFLKSGQGWKIFKLLNVYYVLIIATIIIIIINKKHVEIDSIKSKVIKKCIYAISNYLITFYTLILLIKIITFFIAFNSLNFMFFWK